MTHSSRFDEEERLFLAETLSRDVFSAFDLALHTRRQEIKSFDRKALCERTGREKTGVSKLVNHSGNWTLKTMSDYANALEIDIEFRLVDRIVPTRYFCRTGIGYVQHDANPVFGNSMQNNAGVKLTERKQQWPDFSNEHRQTRLENPRTLVNAELSWK